MRSVAGGSRPDWDYRLLAADADGGTWTRRFDEGWLEWERLGLVNATNVAISSFELCHLEMWVVLAGGLLLHRWTHSDVWSDWTLMELPDGVNARSVTAGSDRIGYQHLVVVDTVGRCWAKDWVDGAWRPWQYAGQDGLVDANLSTDGSELWAVHVSGRIRHRWRLGSDWSDWAWMSVPGAGPTSVAGGFADGTPNQVLALSRTGELSVNEWRDGWGAWSKE
ncbi:PLL family lectin [Myceligenerans halotolerans]